jgi:Flp pilus assembly protein CpaB
MRAVTIQTPNVSTGVAGFILPGNKVDVMLTMSSQGTDDKTGGGSTITLLQNVEILAVDQRIEAPTDNKMNEKELRSVTLMVTPADASKIDLGQNKGTLRLGLRNPADTSTDFVEPVTLAGLLQNPNLVVEAPKPKPASRGLAAVIPPGMRAVTIQTPNVATGVAGFILPGSKVDVLLSMSGQGRNDNTGGGSTITLLQNVEILAVDQRVEAPQEEKISDKELRSVTLLVTPTDAARLELGHNKGILHLNLRNPDDSSMQAIETVTLAGLLQNQNSKPQPKKQAAAQIRTLRGNQLGSVSFQIADEEDAGEAEEPRPNPPAEAPLPLIDPAPSAKPVPAAKQETPKSGTKET